MSVAGAVQLTADLDLGAGHLADLVDFRTLPADDGTNELQGEETVMVNDVSYLALLYFILYRFGFSHKFSSLV